MADTQGLVFRMNTGLSIPAITAGLPSSPFLPPSLDHESPYCENAVNAVNVTVFSRCKSY